MTPAWRIGRTDGDDGPTEVTYARGRLPDRTYASKSFPLRLATSRDFGQPARYVTKVFDEENGEPLRPDGGVSEEVIEVTPGGRKQIKMMVAREAGEVRQLQIQRVPSSASATKLDVLLDLDRHGAARLVELVRALEHIPVEEGAERVRVDDALLREIFRDPAAITELYGRDPEKFRALIQEDTSAEDVVAIAHRKAVLAEFRQLLQDRALFEAALRECGGRPESVWQRFLERNPWVLGISLGGQLLTSWNDEKLEQVVTGFSVAGPGKRTDALLRTAGQIRSMVFAEIKHHRTALLSSSEYRAGCWAPSAELSGGVTQLQQTVYKAVQQIGERLPELDPEGAETGEFTYLVRPRSFVVVGDLDELRGETGVHMAKYRSFELYRRNLYEPEVITFDELLARAEWHVALSDATSNRT